MNYAALENKITNNNNSYFVVRDTEYPVEDLKRNWSATVGGMSLEGCSAFETLEAAEAADKDYYQSDKVTHEYRYHPAHKGYCCVHYEGLGAFVLDVENLKEAIKVALEYEDNLVCTMEAGDGCFCASQVLSFHKVRAGRYIFEIG